LVWEGGQGWENGRFDGPKQDDVESPPEPEKQDKKKKGWARTKPVPTLKGGMGPVVRAQTHTKAERSNVQPRGKPKNPGEVTLG